MSALEEYQAAMANPKTAIRMARWQPMINKMAAKRGIPPTVIAAHIFMESRGINSSPSQSVDKNLPDGTFGGLFQFRGDTGRAYHLNKENAHDPAVQFEAGSQFIADNFKHTKGDLYKMGLAYNGPKGFRYAKEFSQLASYLGGHSAPEIPAGHENATQKAWIATEQSKPESQPLPAIPDFGQLSAQPPTVTPIAAPKYDQVADLGLLLNQQQAQAHMPVFAQPVNVDIPTVYQPGTLSVLAKQYQQLR
jgi:Transglycosylase SLT domain